jgi:hypothetical protein
VGDQAHKLTVLRPFTRQDRVYEEGVELPERAAKWADLRSLQRQGLVSYGPRYHAMRKRGAPSMNRPPPVDQAEPEFEAKTEKPRRRARERAAA